MPITRIPPGGKKILIRLEKLRKHDKEDFPKIQTVHNLRISGGCHSKNLEVRRKKCVAIYCVRVILPRIPATRITHSTQPQPVKLSIQLLMVIYNCQDKITKIDFSQHQIDLPASPQLPKASTKRACPSS